MAKNIIQYLDNMNWPELKLQKEWLIKQKCEHADGLIHMIDALQDMAVDIYHYEEETVFPDLGKESK